MAAKANKIFEPPKSVREVVEENIQYSSYDTGALEELQYTVQNLARAVGVLAQVLVDHNVLSAEDVGEIIGSDVTITRE